MDILETLVRDPESFNLTAENDNPQEPAYISLEEANRGRNVDGTTHGGYFVLDVLDRQVVDLVNTDGTSRLTLTNFGEERIHGGFGPNAANVLGRYMNNFVLVDDRFWTYANPQCRCPQFQATVFSSQELAATRQAKQRTHGFNYSVHRITPEFLDEYRQRHDG